MQLGKRKTPQMLGALPPALPPALSSGFNSAAPAARLARDPLALPRHRMYELQMRFRASRRSRARAPVLASCEFTEDIPPRGGGLQGLAMAIAITLIVLALGSVLFHFLSPWYFTPIASNLGAIDTTITITFWVTGIVFVAVNLFMALAVIRYR